MNGRPCGDHQFVIDADTFKFAASRAAAGGERKCFNNRLWICRRMLNRTQQPLVAFSCGSRDNFFGTLQFLLGLFLLQQVDVEPTLFDVIDN